MMKIARFERVSADQYRKDTEGLDALPLEELPLPSRATAGSAGYDFAAACAVTLQPGESATIPTGMRALIDQGWVLLLFPRSSMGFKYDVMLANTVGVIDSDYSRAANEGHIMVRLHNNGSRAFHLECGDRMCQGVFLPFGTAEEETVAAGRNGGFGSTGR